MTLTQLLADYYRRTGFSTTVDSATSTRATSFLNEVQQEILSEPGMESLLFDSMTFDSVASTPQYSLPRGVGRIRQMTQTSHDLALGVQSLHWYRSAYPDPTASTGIPEAWVDLGYVAYSVPPSNASTVFVDSTSASDTNTAYLEGIRTGGYAASVSVTMTGVTAVELTAAITDWISLTKFYLSVAAVGTVTLHEDASGGTELSRIPIGETRAQYRRIALAICPSSAITYTVDFERNVTDMINGTDEPVLPPQFHRLLVSGARLKEYLKQNQMDRFTVAKLEYEKGIRKLKYFLYSQAVGTPNLMGRGASRMSRLGPWFPVGT